MLGAKAASNLIKIAIIAMIGLAAAGNSVMASGPKKVSKEPVTTKWVAPKTNLETQSLSGTPVLVLREPGQKAKINVYQFDISKSWGLKFEFNQPQSQPLTKTDIDAGAYFRLNPSLSLGGSLGFGEKSNSLAPKTQKPQDDDGAPRVRLETQFKF